MPKEEGGIKGITYPIVADTDKTISANFGVLAGDYELDENDNLTANGPMIAFRGLFLIDKTGTIQHQVVNNFPELNANMTSKDPLEFEDHFK